MRNLFILLFLAILLIDFYTIRHFLKNQNENRTLFKKVLLSFCIIIGITSLSFNMKNFDYNIYYIGTNFNIRYSINSFAIKKLSIHFPIGIIIYWIKHWNSKKI